MQHNHQSSPLDLNALLEAVADERAVLVHLLKLAVDEDAPRLFSELDTAAARGDLTALHAAAHGIKGLVAELKAEPCHRAAVAVEAAASAGHTAECTALVAELHAQWGKLEVELRELIRAGAPS